MNTAPLVTRPDPSQRLAAAIAHAGTLVAWFLAPLIVYLVMPRDSRWARYQALQSLLWSLLGTLVSLATCGLAIPIFLAWHIIAAYKTLSDREYAYALVGRAAYDAVYGAA